MSTQFRAYERSYSDPAHSAYVITPNDSTMLSAHTRGIYVGGVGDLTVLIYNDTVAVTFVGVPAGTLLPIRVSKVLATGTTATNLVGLI